jgi:hypothetical protein
MVDAPPNSVHFAEATRLKVPKAAARAASTPPEYNPILSTAAPSPAPTLTPVFAPAPPPTLAPSINDLFLQQLLQNQQPNLLLNLLLQQSQHSINPLNLQHLPQFRNTSGAQGLGQPPVILPPPLSAPSSLVKALPHIVPLAEFCTFYSVLADTGEKLRRLDVMPGDVRGIVSLE